MPYGPKTVRMQIPGDNYVETVVPREVRPAQDDDVEVASSLDQPIGSPPLEKVAKATDRVVIVTDDYTRPTPVARILPQVLDRLHQAGIPREHISIVVALGTHRAMKQEEIEAKLGAGPSREYHVVNKSVHQNPEYTYVCESAMGIPVWVLNEVVEADLRIGIGSIVPHCDVGYSGGAKIILPGVCSAQAVSVNHMKGLDFRGVNMLGAPTTPIRQDIEDAVARIGLDFIANTVTTSDGRLYKMVCGHPVEAHRAGIPYAREVYGVPVRQRVDISICGTHPGNVDFIQVCKTYWSGDKMTRPGGDLIIVTPCTEGVGPYTVLPSLMAQDRHDLERRIRSGEIAADTAGVMTSLAIRLNRIGERLRVSMVTDGLPRTDADQMGLTLYDTVEDALAAAINRQGNQATASVMTHGGYTFPMVSGEPEVPSSVPPTATKFAEG